SLLAHADQCADRIEREHEKKNKNERQHRRRQCMRDVIFRNVGPSDGGRATTAVANSKRVTSIDSLTTRLVEMPDGMCGNAILKRHAKAVARTMPQRRERRTGRACKTAVVKTPTKKTIKAGDAKCAFILTAGPESLTITPACCNPMNAINKPIPAAILFFRLGLIELKISLRNPISDKIKKSTPETNTTPSATCPPLAKPAAVAAGSAEKTKKKFSPIPAACAIGYLA